MNVVLSEVLHTNIKKKLWHVNVMQNMHCLFIRTLQISTGRHKDVYFFNDLFRRTGIVLSCLKHSLH